MCNDVRLRYVIIAAKDRKQKRQRLQLVRGWFVVVEVSDEGDSDRFFVHIAGFAVGALLLPNPSGRHFNLAVTFAHGSVIDQEMVAEAVRKASIPV